MAEARAESDPFTAKHFAEKAVEAYRAIGGQADQINQLQHWMIELGKNAAASENIHRIRIDVDVKEVQQKYRNAAAGHQDYPSAMLAMVRSLVSVLPRRKSVESSVREEARKYPLRSFAAGTICSSDGRTQAKVPSMPEDPAGFLWSETCSRTVQMLHLSAEAAVVPAREVVWEEHRPSRGEISALLRHSPFVPPSRVDLFAEGFYCGFLGRDYFGAHILLPQVEHSLRVLAEKAGGLTSSLKQDMVQDAHSLNTLLEENSTVASSLGEDLLLNLRALLTERSGSNFRNELLHGLCQPSESRRLDGVSVWYLATILCHGQLLSQPVAAVK